MVQSYRSMRFPFKTAATLAGGMMAHRQGLSTRRRAIPQKTSSKNQYSETLTVLGTGQRRRPLRNSFHGKLLQNETCFHNYTSDNTLAKAGPAFLHNNNYLYSPSQSIAQGTAEGNRVGNTCHLHSLRVNFFYASPAADSNGVQLRIITFFYDDNIATPGGAFVTNNLPALFFGTGTGVVNATTSLTDPKVITVLDDRMYAINPQFSGVQDTIVGEYTVDVEKNFTYQSNSVFGKEMNLYIVVISSIVGGATGVTSTGSINMCTDLIFRNSR